MEKVLLVDDDPITIAIVRKILENAAYIVTGYTDPVSVAESYRQGEYVLVITDLMMPGMSGHELVMRIRERDPDVPMMVLTGSVDIDKTVELFRHGVTDYIIKPVVPEDLLHRIRSCIDEHGLRLHIRRVEEEKRLIELESRKLVNWRMLYAYKDINQTEQMINLLTRTINAEGGFAWLDLIAELPRRPDGGIDLDKDVLDLVLSAGRSMRTIIDYLSFISKIPRMEFKLEPMSAMGFTAEILEYGRGELSGLCARHRRTLSVHAPRGGLEGIVAIDSAQLKRVCRELVVNAVKYSPEQSGISLELAFGSGRRTELAGGMGRCHDGDHVYIIVKNHPRTLQAKTGDGNPIVGIPYEYSELVFDLFFTIENFSTENADEEWPDGTGLYVARKLLGRMKALVDTSSLVDNTGDSPRPLVQFAVSIPVSTAS